MTALKDDNGKVIKAPNGRVYCARHNANTYDPKKYDKCFLCKIEDGELIECQNCVAIGKQHPNYHSPEYSMCYECSHKGEVIVDIKE